MKLCEAKIHVYWLYNKKQGLDIDGKTATIASDISNGGPIEYDYVNTL